MEDRCAGMPWGSLHLARQLLKALAAHDVCMCGLAKSSYPGTVSSGSWSRSDRPEASNYN